MASPNDSGRSWEAILCLAFAHLGGNLTERTRSYNARDKVSEATVPVDLMRAAMSAAGVVLEDWDSLRRFSDPLRNPFLVDRQPDRAPGNAVADITLTAASTHVAPARISAKSNNQSLRHNRPRTLAQPFGRGETDEDVTHRRHLLLIDREIRRRFPRATQFSQLSREEKNAITFMVAIVCTRSIQAWTETNPHWTEQFIRFLLGSEDDTYYVIRKDKNDVTNVYRIAPPQTISVKSVNRLGRYVTIDALIDSAHMTFRGRVHSCTTDISHPGESSRSDYRDEWKFDWTCDPYIGDALGSRI